MATSPAGVCIVRPVTDDGVAEGIEDERDQECCPYKRRLQTHYGAIKEQQEIRKAIVLDAVGYGAKAVSEADAQADRFTYRVFAVCCVRDLDNLLLFSEMPALCSNSQLIGEHGHDNCLALARAAHEFGVIDKSLPPRQTLAARSRVWYKHRTISQSQPQADVVAIGWYGS